MPSTNKSIVESVSCLLRLFCNDKVMTKPYAQTLMHDDSKATEFVKAVYCAAREGGDKPRMSTKRDKLERNGTFAECVRLLKEFLSAINFEHDQAEPQKPPTGSLRPEHLQEDRTQQGTADGQDDEDHDWEESMGSGYWNSNGGSP